MARSIVQHRDRLVREGLNALQVGGPSALELLEMAVDLGEDSPHALIGYALALAQDGRFDDADVAYARACGEVATVGAEDQAPFIGLLASVRQRIDEGVKMGLGRAKRLWER